MITKVKGQIAQMIAQIRARQNDVVGVDIGQGHITVAVLKKAPQLEMKDLIVQRLSASQSDNEVSGVIRDIFHQKQLSKKEVWLNLDLSEAHVNYRRLSLPFMPASELPGAIKWNLKDKITLDANSCRLEYGIIGESAKQDGTKAIDITAVLVENSLINRYVDIFHKAGIDLAGISLTPFSLANILSIDQNLAGQKEPVALCHIGIEYCYVCVIVSGKVAFVRHIPLAEDNFLNAMTGAFITDKGRVELTIEDAKKIMEEFGIPKETDVVLGGKVAAGQVLAMIRPLIERFIGELSRSVDYYQREYGSKINKIFLTGVGSYVKGLDDFISKATALKVEALVFPEDVLNGPVFGAATGPRDKLNLLPEELRHKKQEAVQTTALRLSTTAVLGLLLFSFLTATFQIASYAKQLKLLNNQKAILKEFKDIQDKISARQAVIAAARSQEVPVDLLMKELSVCTPGTIAFLQLQVDQNQKALKIHGETAVKPEIVQSVLSEFMTRLEQCPFVRDAQLAKARLGSSGAEENSVFDINCSIGPK